MNEVCFHVVQDLCNRRSEELYTSLWFDVNQMRWINTLLSSEILSWLVVLSRWLLLYLLIIDHLIFMNKSEARSKHSRVFETEETEVLVRFRIPSQGRSPLTTHLTKSSHDWTLGLMILFGAADKLTIWEKGSARLQLQTRKNGVLYQNLLVYNRGRSEMGDSIWEVSRDCYGIPVFCQINLP